MLDNPLDGFAFGKLHGLSDGRGEVDVPLFTGFALNELDFSRESHRWLFSSLTSHITRYHKCRRITTGIIENDFYLVNGQSPGEG